MTCRYQVDIVIDGGAVKKIRQAGQSITFIRPVSAFVTTDRTDMLADDHGAAPYSVAWLAFPPFQNNVVAWTDACDLFASTTPGTVGKVITVNAATRSARAGQAWTFRSGHFSQKPPGGGAAHVATNLGTDDLGFGLLAQATVNSGMVWTAPMNLQPVLAGQTMQFTARETVQILLSTAASNGTIIPYVGGDAGLTVAPTNNTPLAVGFNAVTNQFYRSE